MFDYKNHFKTFKNYSFLLTELIKRDISGKYKDSTLGLFWSFLNPLLSMIVLTIVFSTFFGRTIENFPVYLLSGKLVFDLFANATTGAMDSIKGNSEIIKKIYVPKYMFAVSAVCYEFVNFLISFAILFGVMIVTGAEFHPTLILSLIPIGLLFMLVFGLGLILAVCNTYFSDIGYLYNVFTLILMYASALFYPIEVVPVRVQILFTLNPVYTAISTFRECVYGVVPDFLSLAYLGVFAVTVLIIGIILFRMYEKKLSLEL